MEKEMESSDCSDVVVAVCKVRKSRNKYEMTPGVKTQVETLPDVLEFIVRLQGCIERQKRKLQRIKKKKGSYRDKKKVKCLNVGVQTEDRLQMGPECVKEVKSISEEITEAAQQALHHNGFVYEETSGMYYDYNSGYYYNAEYGLYYDGNSGTYLKYNQETKEYEFHSQVAGVVKNATLTGLKTERRKTRRKGDQRDGRQGAVIVKRTRTRDNHEDLDDHTDDLEEGECSDGTVPSDDSSELDYAKQWPPCMRIIIEESSTSGLKRGSLHLITYEGGSLGREGDHSILLPDINTSKHHLRFTFDKKQNYFLVTDVGSRNGTYLNGTRLSPSKMESRPTEVPHGSKLQIGATILLCHIHDGNQTCGHCEPGLIQIETHEKTEVKSTKLLEHKKQLKELRKKFGITYSDPGKVIPGSGYQDRAQIRRETIGSQNPHEKTQAASLTESIAPDNKGFKLLSKMGWKEGQALGKDNQGRLEPVEIVSNPGTSGMGNDVAVPQVTKAVAKKRNVWAKTQERFNKIDETDIFEEN